MPSDLNRVTLVGRLTRDPEVRHLKSGDPVASMRVAVNSRGRGDDGQWTDKPNFFDVSVFGRQAETVSQYLSKGRRIGIDGRLSWREWEAPDGTKRQTVEVVANDIFFLDGRSDGDGPSDSSGGGWSAEGAPAAPGGDLPVDTSDISSPAPAPAGDDDIPF
ncbi:MAG: single-stranded DNA-binding protein [Thermoleophilia bacterium]|nr:single-stranded DNA-binding protein [Thermoleophilia bacterium]